jgi:hypothetical protein
MTNFGESRAWSVVASKQTQNTQTHISTALSYVVHLPISTLFRVAINSILSPMPLRIPLSRRLRRTNTPLRTLARLVHLPRRWVDRAALALRNRAVVASPCAVFDGAARELGRYRFVDAGVGY